jgi:hypothetical protein
MDLPTSLLSSTVASGKLSAAAGVDSCSLDPSQGDADYNPFNNGYDMTRFLIALSEGQNCFADMIIQGVMTEGQSLIGAGRVTIGDGSGGDPQAVQIDKTGDTYQVWLYFDATDTNVLYITWTSTSETDFTGQFIMNGDLSGGADPGAPDKIRVDFTRSTDRDENKVYTAFPAGNPEDFLDGFRVDVTRNGIGTSAIYNASGIMTISGQIPGITPPAGQTFPTPALTMVTIANSVGAGASIAGIDDMAMNLDFIVNSTGYNFGAYVFDISERTYFDSTGTEEWRYNSVTDAYYFDELANNSRTDLDGGTTLNFIYSALEGDAALGLGAGYFTSPCTDTHLADCTDLWQAIYNSGGFGGLKPPNDLLADQPADFRKDAIDAAVQLTSAWPVGEDETTAFIIPTAP